MTVATFAIFTISLFGSFGLMAYLTEGVAVVQEDLVDPASQDVLGADLEARFVQWGTTTPYSGNGAPGVNLHVHTNGSVLEWTLEAWATSKTPPPLKTCSLDTIHFSSHDWIYQAQGNSATATGIFVSTPSTVPQRLGPGGDQCLFRVMNTGPWEVQVCIEGKAGGPRGIYDAEDGRHVDAWDRCLDQVFQVEV